MRSHRMRGAALSLAIVLGACAGSATPTLDPFAGQYTGSGGGAALDPNVKALTARFAQLHPGVTWQLEDVGSDSGVNLTQKGDVDFGFISRDLKANEKGSVQLLSVGLAGTAIAVNADNPVRSLTKQQVADIYSGKITNWSQVGGDPGQIRVLLREANAATRSAFESFFFDGKPTYSKDVIEVYEIDETLKAIYSFKDAIGMVTLASRTLTDPKIHLMGIDGVAATKDNLANGTYKIRRPLYLIYNNDPAKLKPAVKAFLDFIRGPEGQQVLNGL